jgi:hypothetical protein
MLSTPPNEGVEMSLYRIGVGQVVVALAAVVAVVLAVGFTLNFLGVISFV